MNRSIVLALLGALGTASVQALPCRADVVVRIEFLGNPTPPPDIHQFPLGFDTEITLMAENTWKTVYIYSTSPQVEDFPRVRFLNTGSFPLTLYVGDPQLFQPGCRDFGGVVKGSYVGHSR